VDVHRRDTPPKLQEKGLVVLDQPRVAGVFSGICDPQGVCLDSRRLFNNRAAMADRVASSKSGGLS